MKAFQQAVLSLIAVGMLFLSILVILPSDAPSAQTGQGSDQYFIFLPAVYNQITISKGIATPTGTPSCQDATNVNAEWYYNWTAYPDTGCPLDSMFVPRIWGESGMALLNQFVNNAQPSGWLIGFNEPNLSHQSNISPERGAVLWRQIEQAALPSGIKLVSPAPNQYEPGNTNFGNDGNGHQWTWKMVEAYESLYGEKPHFDAIGWHIYSPDAQTMKNYLMARRSEANARGYGDVKIWVLEYNGCFVQNNPTAVMSEMVAWFEAQDWISRYAWYPGRPSPDLTYNEDVSDCMLFDAEGNIQPVGEQYRAIETN